MHRSRLVALIIDCDDLEAGTRFWTGALGVGKLGRADVGNRYVMLDSPVPKLQIWLQGVPDKKGGKSRAHLDFESDEVEAEVVRLEALGARRIRQIDEFWNMEDPCGNEFCVLPRFSKIFDEEARTWDSGAEAPAESVS